MVQIITQYVIYTPIGSSLDVRAAVSLWDCGPKLFCQRFIEKSIDGQYS